MRHLQLAAAEAPLRRRLPLGPLAGQTLFGVRTPSGKSVHFRRDCSQLAGKTRLMEVPLVQPVEGSFADANLEGLHCTGHDAAGTYIDLVKGLEAETERTARMQEKFVRGALLDLAVRDYGGLVQPLDSEPYADHPALAAEAGRLRAVQEGLLSSAWAELGPHSRRVQLMIVADWVGEGRTRREYQPQFEQLIDVGQRALAGDQPWDRLWIAGAADRWLRWVRNSGDPAGATAHLIEEYAAKDTVARMAGAWSPYLQGLVEATSDRKVVLFLDGGHDLDRRLQHVLRHVCPWASTRWADTTLNAAVLPGPTVLAMRRQGDDRSSLGEDFVDLGPARSIDDEKMCRAILTVVEAEVPRAVREGRGRLRPGPYQADGPLSYAHFLTALAKARAKTQRVRKPAY